jgi:hypothetical protein
MNRNAAPVAVRELCQGRFLESSDFSSPKNRTVNGEQERSEPSAARLAAGDDI